MVWFVYMYVYINMDISQDQGPPKSVCSYKSQLLKPYLKTLWRRIKPCGVLPHQAWAWSLKLWSMVPRCGRVWVCYTQTVYFRKSFNCLGKEFFVKGDYCLTLFFLLHFCLKKPMPLTLVSLARSGSDRGKKSAFRRVALRSNRTSTMRNWTSCSPKQPRRRWMNTLRTQQKEPWVS